MAQEIEIMKQDGNSWRNMSNFGRLQLINGFILGTGHVFLGGHMPENVFMKEGQVYNESKAFQALLDVARPKKQYTREEVGLIMEQRNRTFNSILNKHAIIDITTGQIVDGLGKFYEDFRNRGILLRDAIYVVKKQIKGASPEEVDAVCEYLRSDYKFEKLMYKSKDGTTTYAEFP